MSFFKSMFQPSKPKDSELILEYFKDLNINSEFELPQNYYEMFEEEMNRSQNPLQFFESFIKCLPKMTNIASTVKVYTIVFRSIVEKKYDRQFCQSLMEMEFPKIQKTEPQDIGWFHDMCVSCTSYLVKLPSVRDIYEKARLIKHQPNIDFKADLIDIFRLINQVSLVFPHFNNGLNVIGRYYLKSSLFFSQFYRVIRNELLMLYGYLKHLIDHILEFYQQCDLVDLGCFIKTLPEIELAADKIEDFLMNKYFRGKGPSKKIYFNEEQIGQIVYYVQTKEKKTEKGNRSQRSIIIKKGEDVLSTRD